jgi:hypothetical protein
MPDGTPVTPTEAIHITEGRIVLNAFPLPLKACDPLREIDATTST